MFGLPELPRLASSHYLACFVEVNVVEAIFWMVVGDIISQQLRGLGLKELLLTMDI